MKTYLRILSYAGPVRRLMLLYFLATIPSIFFGLANLSLLIPLLEVLFSQDNLSDTLATIPKPAFCISLNYLKSLFSHHFVQIIGTYGRISALYFVCVIMLLSVLLANLFRYLAEMVIAELRTNVVYNLRKDLFSQVTQLHLGYFTEQHKGDIMARVMSDVQEVERTTEYTFRAFLKEPATIVGFFTVLFYLSPQLTWLALLSLPIVGGGITEIVRRLLKQAAQSQTSLGHLMHLLEETLGGMHLVKAFAARPYVVAKFEQENQSYAKLNFAIFLKNSLMPLLSEFLGLSVMTLVLAYGGQLVLSNASKFTTSTFMTYIIIFSQAMVPVKSISKSLSNIQRGLAAGARIFFLLDTPPAIVNVPGARKIDALQQGITFENVSFAYQQQPVIKPLNLTLQPGKKVALVGPSGSGKSTLMHLLSRSYDVTQGVIRLDGRPLQDYDLTSLQQLMGIVTQEPLLFHDTVFNNIALGRPEASEEAIKVAARIAHAHEFIEALPQGYHTVIGERGSKLSGGQKQQLTIARAVLGHPPILILDEATAALDSTLASQIQAAIDQLMQDHLLVVIAHRLSTVQNADEILVMEAGTIVERGTHTTLMQQEGLYKRLSMLQD
ncbi:MAG: ABC transporter ATP-binding protein [Roseivirga sp.]